MTPININQYWYFQSVSSKNVSAKNFLRLIANPSGIFRELLLNTIGHNLLNTFKKKTSNQVIFINKAKLKNLKNWENQFKWEPCKLVLYSTLQTFKNKIMQIPVWQWNKIISTHFVCIYSAHIKALTEITKPELSNQAMKWYQ